MPLRDLENRITAVEDKLKSIERALWAVATLIGGAVINYFLDILKTTQTSPPAAHINTFGIFVLDNILRWLP